MDTATIERLGQLIDKLDNYLEYTEDNTFTKMLPVKMIMEALGQGLKEARQEVFDIYTELGGTNEWADSEE